MASFRSTKLKITIGYILLLAILLFSLVFVHQEMETLSAADDQQNLRTDSLLSLLHEKDQNTLQMLRVLSEANDSLLSASEIEEIISEQQDSVITQQRVQHRVITKRDSLLPRRRKASSNDWGKCSRLLRKILPCWSILLWKLPPIRYWNLSSRRTPFSIRFAWLPKRNGCSGGERSGVPVRGISG